MMIWTSPALLRKNIIKQKSFAKPNEQRKIKLFKLPNVKNTYLPLLVVKGHALSSKPLDKTVVRSTLINIKKEKINRGVLISFERNF
jgi:hypothetical protein